MASEIKRGESLLIPFRNGKSIYDSQCKPRIYKTVKGFEKHFPGHYMGKDGVELVEFVEVVRCKDCRFGMYAGLGKVMCDVYPIVEKAQFYCAYGERKTDV